MRNQATVKSHHKFYFTIDFFFAISPYLRKNILPYHHQWKCAPKLYSSFDHFTIWKKYKNHCTSGIFKSSNYITISPYHDFTVSPFMPKKLICHWTISPFGKKYKNHCTISPPNQIDLFKSSYHITISSYHDFTISPFVPKNWFTVGPFHHLENNTKIIALFHHQTILIYSNHPIISPFYPIVIPPFRHFTSTPWCYKLEPIQYDTNISERWF